ncbi:MAG: response regulator [Bacteroidetes bacterium]|nr:response regulator [Bacteroidota bacterium]
MQGIMLLTQQPKIFIVEDNLLYQQLIAREMESISSDISFYTKGEHCVENLHQNPSIIILDYNLDGDMNGLDTLQEIRKFDASICVILFSNQKNLNTNENRRQYGSFNFIEKKEQSFQLLKKMVSISYAAGAETI